jgi:dienelactone hydrolase
MPEIVVFHHAQGRTEGVLAFADDLRAAGHTVHVPDLYDGRVLATLPEGLAVVEALGFPTILERGRRAVDGLAADLVYIGFSLGVMPAQLLAQTRPGASGAVFAHSAVNPQEFGGPWPSGVPLQIHMAEDDPQVNPPYDDLQAARALEASGAELFLYPGDAHLFTDRSLPDHEEAAASRFVDRVLAFLSRQ